jgi:hypothetical protein
MDHSAHEPGTVADCPECQAASYEPGWYKAMRAERAGIPVVIPEAGPDDLEIVLPDLEHVRPEDEDR